MIKECSYKPGKWDRHNPPNTLNVYVDSSSQKINDHEWESTWKFVVVRAKYVEGEPVCAMPDTDDILAEYSGVGNLPSDAAGLFAFGQALSYCMLYLNPFSANFRVPSKDTVDYIRGNRDVTRAEVLAVYGRVHPLYVAAKGKSRYSPVRLMGITNSQYSEYIKRLDLGDDDPAEEDVGDTENRDFLVKAEGRFMGREDLVSPSDILEELDRARATVDILFNWANSTLGFDCSVSTRLGDALVGLVEARKQLAFNILADSFSE